MDSLCYATKRTRLLGPRALVLGNYPESKPMDSLFDARLNRVRS